MTRDIIIDICEEIVKNHEGVHDSCEFVKNKRIGSCEFSALISDFNILILVIPKDSDSEKIREIMISSCDVYLEPECYCVLVIPEDNPSEPIGRLVKALNFDEDAIDVINQTKQL